MRLFGKKKIKIEGKIAKEWFDLALEEEDPEKKVEYYTECLELDPKNAIAWNNRGLALCDLVRYEEAIRCFDNVLEIAPEDEDAWYSKGSTLDKLGRLEEAIRCYDNALEINPKDDIALFAKADALDKLGRYEEEIKCYDDVLKIDPKDYIAWYYKGSVLCDLERYEEAIRCYDKAIEIDPEYKEVKKAKRIAEEKLKKEKKEKEKRRIEGKTANEWFDLALEEEDPEEAIEYFSKCLKLDPKNKYAWYNEGHVLYKLGRYEEVIRCFDNVLEIAPEDVEAWHIKGISLYKLGRYEEAIRCYDKALDIRPKSELTWHFKGDAFEKLGRYKEAIRCYDKAIEIDPEYEEAKENKTIAEEKLREQEGKLRDLREKAWKSLSEEENIFNETKNKGVIISTDLLTKSKQAFDNGDYEGSVRLSEELKSLVNNTEIKYREARDWINSAEFAIEKSKEFGCDTSEAEELLNRAKAGFDEGNYAQVISDASKGGEIAKEIKEKSKPEIEVDLSEKTFQPNVWEEISLNIFNKGNAHAKDIEIGLSEEVKVKDLEIIRSLNAGEKKDLAVSFKPVEVGRVPLEISTHFKDFDEKEYEEKNRMRIHVGEKRKEYKETQIEIIIERAIYDPCKGDFIERALPRMKEWINRYEKGAYWFAISIQNNTDKEINDWDVEIKTSSALKIKEAKIEGIEERIPQESHLGTFKLSVSKAHGYPIPKGGQRRVYFKLRAEKPKTTYEISGVFKSAITGDVPIRTKEFKYLCDVRMSPEAVKPELKKTFSEKDAAMLTLAFKTVRELDRMCNQNAKTEDYFDKLSVLKNYTEGFSANFTMQVDDFSRFMEQEQLGYLDDEYRGKVRRFCTILVDVWISEFLKG